MTGYQCFKVHYHINVCAFVSVCVRHFYLASDVWRHGRGGLGVDVCILRHEARVVGGDAAEAVSGDAPRWRRLVRQTAAVAIGGGGWWSGWVGLGASTTATNTTTTASPWWTGGTTVGAVDAAAGGWKVQRSKGECGEMEGWGARREQEGDVCHGGLRRVFVGRKYDDRDVLKWWFGLKSGWSTKVVPNEALVIDNDRKIDDWRMHWRILWLVYVMGEVQE